ncbi:MAG: TonB-dependent receptor plug domain-containing protein [Desulfobulbus sp.]|jgi:vitamin B12 transporter
MRTSSRFFPDQLLFALALVPLTAPVALAAPPKEPAIRVQADEMVVTAGRTATREIDTPVATQVIDRERIEMSGVTNVGDLLGKYMTGHYHKYTGMLSPVGLRGFRTDATGLDINGGVLILVDGHRLGTGNAAKIDMDRIERVEIIKGPASALYGSAAMGGVVNLITKKGEGPMEGAIGVEAGSFDLYKGTVSGGGEINDRLRFFAAASGSGSDDYDDPTFGRVYNSGEERFSIGGNLIYAFNDRHELRFGGNYSNLVAESPRWIAYKAYSSYDRDVRDEADKSTGYADLEYNGDFFDGKVHWRGMGYYLWDRNEWREGAIDPESDRSKMVDSTLGTDHQLSWKTADWNTLLVGFTLEDMERKSSAHKNYLPSTPYSPGLEYDNRAVFLQDALDLFDNRVNLVGGLRYDRFKIKSTQPETGSFSGFRGRSESYSHVSPKLGASIKFFDETLRLRGNIGEGFKSPTADHLSSDYMLWGVRYLGNPDLDPETSRTYDVGVDLYLDALTLKVGYFHTDYEDRVEQYWSAAHNAFTYRNAKDDVTIAGFEGELRWDVDKSFSMPFGLALWTNMLYNTDKKDDATNRDVKYVSDYEIKSGLDFRHQNFTAQLSHVLVGPQMIDNWDTYTEEEKGSFQYWDLTLRYVFREHWEIKGSVLNLFDQDVEWVRGYLMPERNYRIGLTYHF